KLSLPLLLLFEFVVVGVGAAAPGWRRRRRPRVSGLTGFRLGFGAAGCSVNTAATLPASPSPPLPASAAVLLSIPATVKTTITATTPLATRRRVVFMLSPWHPHRPATADPGRHRGRPLRASPAGRHARRRGGCRAREAAVAVGGGSAPPLRGRVRQRPLRLQLSS